MTKKPFSVWVDGFVLGLLRKVSVEKHRSMSDLVRGFVEDGLRSGCVSDDGFLLHELDVLAGEMRVLRRSEDLILASASYLQRYVEIVIKGGKIDKDYRESLLSYPNADKVIPAFEVITARRQEIALRVADIIRQLYPNLKYEEVATFIEQATSRKNKVERDKVFDVEAISDYVTRKRAERSSDDNEKIGGGEK